MMMRMAKYLNFVITYAKNIILRKYYHFYLHYFKLSKRKKIFITKLLFKNSDRATIKKSKVANIMKVSKNKRNKKYELLQ